MSRKTSQNKQLEYRDPESGRFLTGNNGGGRPKGSRNKLGEAFIADLHQEWQRSGAEALKRVAQEDPAAFVRVVAGILPRELDATLNVIGDADEPQNVQELLAKVAAEVSIKAAKALAEAFEIEWDEGAIVALINGPNVPQSAGYSRRMIRGTQADE